jgi:anti-anti-sigma factor
VDTRDRIDDELFVVAVNRIGDEVVLALCGELDEWTKPRFVAALALVEEADVRVVLDLADLAFIDVGCIGEIHRARNRAADRGTELTLRSPNRLLARILDLTGLGPSISTWEGRDSFVGPSPWLDPEDRQLPHQMITTSSVLGGHAEVQLETA